ncbi:hypothetical protein DFJ73DRAFT_603436, partial [Zopfochytrium polystomum]
IAIGIAGFGYPMDRLPGWNMHSVAMHSLTEAYRRGGAPYGPAFGPGDVVGCGLFPSTGGCFFTVNGEYVGEAFYDLNHPDYHVTVGADGPCELRFVFGDGPFAYKIAN